MLRSVGWFLVNVLQALFTGSWSALWMSLAVVVPVLTGSEELPLAMARRFWAPPLLFFAGTRVLVEGLERVDLEQPCVFAMNHESMIDIAIAIVALPVNLHFITKRELARVPFLGWYIWAA